MRTRLRLFLDWGITFGEAYQTPDRGRRKVWYANKQELEEAILRKFPREEQPERMVVASPPPAAGAMSRTPVKRQLRDIRRPPPRTQ